MSKYINPLLHLVVVLAILALPAIALILNPDQYRLANLTNYFLTNLINFGTYLFVFSFAVPRFLLEGRNLRFYLSTLSVIILSGIIKLCVFAWFDHIHMHQIFTITIGEALGLKILLFTIFSLLFAIGGALLRFTVDWFKNRQQMLKMELELKRAELAMLKYQMYPHFLFNTLNNIYALTKKSDPRASESMAKLSDILRYLLYQSDEGLVKLEDDIETLKSFIDLELLRKEDPDYLRWCQEGSTGSHMIPPMLLLPLVENAFKHGAGRKMPVIEVSCRIDGKQLDFRVINTKLENGNNPIEASGIGLVNVRKRLEISYPGTSELRIDDQKDQFVAQLTIPFTK